ncbi:phasin family protein [Enterovirga rhinocerotis]|uniref:Phasin protein n=1 Tax=Enterovirga rhinocerotis TaxID=1339210 RepID=A0A4R7CB61_9HYPH|nr:phasin family protein [Enterovirga rhinocerotis]TDR93987.1 phasin protein [Enterovirga rhinocerotis]
MVNLDSFTKLSREGADAALKSFTALSTGAQAVTSESVDYVKRSFEAGQKASEQLLGAKTLDVAMQIQGDYLRSSYEGLVAQTAKMGQLAVSVAKDAAAPLETLMAKPTVS